MPEKASIQNVFCTLAMGAQHVEYAKFLCADLRAYGAAVLVVTDLPQEFRSFPNVHVVEHRPKQFSYHDKRIVLQEALKFGETAIFVDADTAVWFGADRRIVRKALVHEFPPGLHALRLFPEDVYHYPNIEALAKEWGLKFNRNVITYWEGLFAVTRDKNLNEFFSHWDKFAEEARQRGYNGAGEGTCFGIAAEAAGIQRHYTTHMVQSSLSNIFWHTRLRFSRRKLYHFKFGLTEMLRGNLNLNQHCWAFK